MYGQDSSSFTQLLSHRISHFRFVHTAHQNTSRDTDIFFLVHVYYTRMSENCTGRRMEHLSNCCKSIRTLTSLCDDNSMGHCVRSFNGMDVRFAHEEQRNAHQFIAHVLLGSNKMLTTTSLSLCTSQMVHE